MEKRIARTTEWLAPRRNYSTAIFGDRGVNPAYQFLMMLAESELLSTFAPSNTQGWRGRWQILIWLAGFAVREILQKRGIGSILEFLKHGGVAGVNWIVSRFSAQALP